MKFAGKLRDRCVKFVEFVKIEWVRKMCLKALGRREMSFHEFMSEWKAINKWSKASEMEEIKRIFCSLKEGKSYTCEANWIKLWIKVWGKSLLGDGIESECYFVSRVESVSLLFLQKMEVRVTVSGHILPTWRVASLVYVSSLLSLCALCTQKYFQCWVSY